MLIVYDKYVFAVTRGPFIFYEVGGLVGFGGGGGGAWKKMAFEGGHPKK